MSLRDIQIYILIFFTYSFLGWCMESFGGILKEKKFINRGFLIGPYCPVYGFGVIIVTLLLSNYKNDFPVLFVLSTVICGTLEYLTSYVMEKLFNARWWDYHNRKFNINGRICLETLIPFGIAATIILSYINPFLINLYNKLNNMQMNIITGFLGVVFIIDSIISFTIISKFKGETYSTRDNTEEIGNMVKDKTEEFGNMVIDKTEELGNIVKDTTENVLEKAESNVKLFAKTLKLGRLKFKKKVKYTRKHISESTLETIKNLSNMVNEQKELITNKILEEKEKFEEEIKLRKMEFELKQNERKLLISNELKRRKEIIENFGKKSILTKRLMKAFPSLQIIPKKKEKK